MKKPRVGVFGAFRGISMIDMLLIYPEAELVAVCDRHLPALEKVREHAKKYDAEVALYENFDDFIEHDMDAVVLANCANEHAPFAIRCLDKGLHVLSECLPCETPAQAVALVEAVERSGKIYSFAENCCYITYCWEMWQKCREDAIGDIVYAECEYIHNGINATPQLTYGDPNHWRSRMHPHFYCTHSLGPIIMASGRTPVQVVGFETPTFKKKEKLVYAHKGCSVFMVTLDNGAVVKVMMGGYEKSGIPWNYQYYGQYGHIESFRFPEQKEFNMYTADREKVVAGKLKRYDPIIEIARDYALKAGFETSFQQHWGADFYAPYFFIQKILGNPDGQWTVDVYQALDMALPGIFAHRSALQGNVPVKVPNFRNKEERDAYRNDNACCTPEVAGDQLLPNSIHPKLDVPPEHYEKMRELWLNKKRLNGDDVPPDAAH